MSLNGLSNGMSADWEFALPSLLGLALGLALSKEGREENVLDGIPAFLSAMRVVNLANMVFFLFLGCGFLVRLCR